MFRAADALKFSVRASIVCSQDVRQDMCINDSISRFRDVPADAIVCRASPNYRERNVHAANKVARSMHCRAH